MDLKYIEMKASEITDTAQHVFYLRPSTAIYFFLVVGLAIAVWFRTLTAILIGGFLMILPIINLVFIKNRPILEIYEDYFFFYDMSKKDDSGFKIFYQDVEEYSFEKEDYGAFIFLITLSDASNFAVPSSNGKLMEIFKKKVPNKEKYIKMRLASEQRAKDKKEERRRLKEERKAKQ